MSWFVHILMTVALLLFRFHAVYAALDYEQGVAEMTKVRLAGATDPNNGTIAQLMKQALDEPHAKEPKEKPATASSKINGAGSAAGMVMVPAGSFLYGEKGKEQELSLPAFLMDLYEVTNAEYAKVRPREYPPEKANHPAVGVTWDEAKLYCEAVGKRLPSEQEWEKGARGTDGRRYPWGDTYDPKKVNAEERNNGTTPVGQFPDGRSPYGLYDMAGNVWEWTTAAGGTSYKPLRGGAWNNGLQFVGNTVRIWNDPSYRDEAFGFRCVKDSPK